MEELTSKAMLQRIQSEFYKSIPTGVELTTKAVAQALGEHARDVEWIKANFSALVEAVQVDAYEQYLSAEQKSGAQALANAFLPLLGARATAHQLVELMGHHFFALDRFFLGLTQGRRPRAGKAFEIVIRELFVLLHYPFSPQPIINGQPDFVMPSLDHFKRHAPDCIIFTVKRTLRERWRQIVTEGTRGLGFYLGTIDEKVSKRDLEEMLASRITLVVPERIKQLNPEYRTAPNVISFEYFFRFHLDPAMARWRESGAIHEG